MSHVEGIHWIRPVVDEKKEVVEFRDQNNFLFATVAFAEIQKLPDYFAVRFWLSQVWLSAANGHRDQDGQDHFMMPLEEHMGPLAELVARLLAPATPASEKWFSQQKLIS